jgi:hypothetical protein
MTKEIKYKSQGDGRDSWEISEYEGDVLMNRFMVYKDPNKSPTPLSDEELIASYNRLKELGVIPNTNS